ncbi:Protein-tyrosine/Dual specificity phosphatase [Phaffia rhodozyma]|uniref:Protein-tyrosine/Dual specificity phosphatase n=1 Tax=Phaffia rhodozyma TaxID=264483 RepID=A0A0F7SMN8_PHARH|nr:Protein-tyrosine/Dual specificity phosphatase [Phaffia rhodozyma]
MSFTLVSSISPQYHPSTSTYSSQSPMNPEMIQAVDQLHQNQYLHPDEEAHRRRAVEAVEGLSCLASQHHRSEYNRMKWGESGAPLYYVPLSIQLPAHVSEIMQRQAAFEAHCSKSSQARHARQLAQDSANNSDIGLLMRGPNGVDRPLEEEEGLEGVLVDDGLTQDEKDNGTTAALVGNDILNQAAHPTSEAASISTAEVGKSTTPVEEQISQAMQDSLLPAHRANPTSDHTKEVRAQAAPLASGHVFTSIEIGRQEYMRKATIEGGEFGPASMGTQGQGQGQLAGQSVKTSNTHPINISIVVPPDYIHYLEPLLHLVDPPSINPPFPSSASHQTFLLPPLLDLHYLSQTNPAIDSAPPILLSSVPPEHCIPNSPASLSTHPDVQSQKEAKPDHVGNFLLSSCPGKKVRLQGPVKGRGAICRDLRVDLERIKGLGVGCIICCLDDDELGYLGAPIHEYENTARAIGLEVMRIPMPEGLTPTSLSQFDAQISSIVTRYTLRGINVLAHCRGGVGRAGLVASSWAIKMGLVSSSCHLVSSSPNSRYSSKRSFGPGGGEYTSADLEITEKVISLVRRRRSVKAIETYEQVRWLVDYVRWLRIEGAVCKVARVWRD